MERSKIVLLAVLILLLLLLFFDRARESRQLQTVYISMEEAQVEFQRLRSDQSRLIRAQEELTQGMDALAQSLQSFHRGLQAGSLQAGDPGTLAQQADPGQQRDGIAVEGRPFLLPYDSSPFDPALLGGQLRGFAQEPTQGLNDMLTSMGATASIARMVSENLCTTRPEDPTRWRQGLATDVLIEENFTRFTFTLRRGVQWHIPVLAREPGREWLRQEVELTAHDFVFYLDMVNNPEVNAPHLRVYYEGASATALDDYTLEVRWEKSEYTNIQFTLGLSPLPRHIYQYDEEGQALDPEIVPIAFNEHWFDRAWGLIGTGPYRLHRFAPRSHVEFRRNPDYWGVTEHFESVRWDLETRQPEPQLLAFKNNQVHSHGLIPSQWRAEVLDQHEPRFAAYDPEGNPQAGRQSPFGWEIISSNRWNGICWNTRRSRLRDPRVRQALAHAFDYERIRNEVFFGLSERSTGPIHPTSPYFNSQTPAYVFDLERAAALLDEAGWVDSNGDGWRDKIIDGERVPLRIEITYYALARTWANLVSLYADSARQIGVEIVASPVEDEEWGRRADNRDFDGFVVVWTSGLDVDFMQLWHSAGAEEPQSSNYASYANPQADIGMEALRTTFDPEQRYRIAGEVADQIYRDQPYLFIGVGKGVVIWHNTAYENAPDTRERLGGVTHGFEHYHPLLTTERSRWHMSRE